MAQTGNLQAGAPKSTVPLLALVMARLAQAPQGRAAFVETKRIAALSTPLQSEGTLLYRKPNYLEKTTTAPMPERLVVDGDRLIIDESGDTAPRVIELSAQPAIATFVDTILGAVTGDLASLQRSYDLSASGSSANWQIMLHPKDPAAARLVQEVRLAGGDQLRSFETEAPNGDTDTLTITPQS